MALGGIWAVMEGEAPRAQEPVAPESAPVERKHARVAEVHVATTEELNAGWRESHPPY